MSIALQKLQLEASKWIQTMRVSWATTLAYRLNFLLMIVGPALVFFFIKYNLWSTIYGNDTSQRIAGYTLPKMIEYQFWVLIIGIVGQGSSSMKISEDIRMGRVSAYFIYPFDFWKFHFASFLALLSVEVCISLLTVFLVLLLHLIPTPRIELLAAGFFFSILVGILWFTIQYSIGLLAFWLEETWVLRVMMVITTSFLSGAIIPLEFFPRIWREILWCTPFPYLTYVPTQIFTGDFSSSLFSAFITTIFWQTILSLFAIWLWRRGLKLYVGAGM